jgi:hypothetical protein
MWCSLIHYHLIGLFITESHLTANCYLHFLQTELSVLSEEIHFQIRLCDFKGLAPQIILVNKYKNIYEFRFPVEHKIYQSTCSYFTAHNWVYWSYNVATCFGSYSHHQAIYYMALWAETCSNIVWPVNSVMCGEMWASWLVYCCVR